MQHKVWISATQRDEYKCDFCYSEDGEHTFRFFDVGLLPSPFDQTNAPTDSLYPIVSTKLADRRTTAAT